MGPKWGPSGAQLEPKWGLAALQAVDLKEGRGEVGMARAPEPRFGLRVSLYIPPEFW